jgi:hypothetical protein
MPCHGVFTIRHTLTLAVAFSAVCLSYEVWPVTGHDVEPPASPALPRLSVDTAYVVPGGKTFHVRRGVDPQAVLDAAQPGDVVSLEAGAAFRGNFVLPKKSGPGWIIIRSSSADEELPLPGTRITPAAARTMPKLVSPNDSPAIQTAAGAHNYRFIAVEFTVAENVTSTSAIVAFGGRHRSLADVPYNLIIDRCFVHGHKHLNALRGVLLNSGASAIIGSHISTIHAVGRDSQAILGYNGPGPFKITNNYLEGAGENVMFGGADPAIPDLVPSDIEISGNHLFKPPSWYAGDPSYAGTPWTRKAILELKNAQRVLIEGNVLENNPGGKGSAVLLTPRNQGNTAPWSVVQDVTFRRNIVRNASVGWKAQGTDDGFPSRQMRRIAIVDNLWLQIDASFFYLIAPIDDLLIDHNTALPVTHSAYHIEGLPPLKRLWLSNNIIGSGTFALRFARIGDPRWLESSFVGNNVLVGQGPGRATEDISGDNRGFRVFTSAASAGLNADGELSGTSQLRAAGLHGLAAGVSLAVLDRARRAASAQPRR